MDQFDFLTNISLIYDQNKKFWKFCISEVSHTINKNTNSALDVLLIPFIQMPAHNAPSEMISIHYHSLTKEGVDKLSLEYCYCEVMQ